MNSQQLSCPPRRTLSDCTHRAVRDRQHLPRHHRLLRIPPRDHRVCGLASREAPVARPKGHARADAALRGLSQRVSDPRRALAPSRHSNLLHLRDIQTFWHRVAGLVCGSLRSKSQGLDTTPAPNSVLKLVALPEFRLRAQSRLARSPGQYEDATWQPS